jgi:hypothetical protein
MDFSPIINAVWEGIWWLIPLLVIITVLKSAWAKGYVGELLVRLVVHLALDTRTYHRFHNVTLPTRDGTTQIDHVFASPFGVFVLETKNMKGWIFGAENQSQWTQTIYKRSFKFQNPLRQNYKHVKALEATLQVPAETIHSVVTFVGGATFKTAMPANVTRGAGFVSHIKSFRTIVFTEPQLSTLLERLASGRLAPTLSTHREHLRNLRSRSNLEADQLCPKCGSPLILRTAKTGVNAGRQFWGCSTFPKCRVIQNVT